MCIFCAAVPMSAAMGAVVAGKQAQFRQQAVESGKELPVKEIPVGKITAAVTGGLLVCSATYHLILVPHLGGVV